MYQYLPIGNGEFPATGSHGADYVVIQHLDMWMTLSLMVGSSYFQLPGRRNPHPQRFQSLAGMIANARKLPQHGGSSWGQFCTRGQAVKMSSYSRLQARAIVSINGNSYTFVDDNHKFPHLRHVGINSKEAKHESAESLNRTRIISLDVPGIHETSQSLVGTSYQHVLTNLTFVS